ncbi:hypothetical protein GCM10010332_53030 [Streptomyces albogriseolus]|nr:hypothetical protein GCM10010332_53030 [Streptomyces albogriseolus]
MGCTCAETLQPPGRGRYVAPARGSCGSADTPRAPPATRRPPAYSVAAASVCFAAASIAARDLRTWLRSVVYQKSGIEAFR